LSGSIRACSVPGSNTAILLCEAELSACIGKGTAHAM
jgi:hypothetical protein